MGIGLAGRRIAGQVEGKQLQFFLYLFQTAAHQPLDRVNDSLRRLDQRHARAAAHRQRSPAALGRNRVQRHHRRHQARTVRAGNHHRRIALHVSNEGVGGSQINSDYACFGHLALSSSQSLGHVADQIAEVAPPVQQRHHSLLRGQPCGLVAFIPRQPLSAQIHVHLAEQAIKFLLRPGQA